MSSHHQAESQPLYSTVAAGVGFSTHHHSPNVTIYPPHTVPTDARNQFQRRLEDHFDTKFVGVLAALFLFINFFIVVLELTTSTKMASFKYNSFNSMYVAKYIAYTASANISYGILALISIKHQRYFIIQLTAILFLMAFIASLIYIVLFNVLLLIIQVLGAECGVYCIFMHLVKAILGCVASFLAGVYFLKIQFDFLPNLNKDTFNPMETTTAP